MVGTPEKTNRRMLALGLGWLVWCLPGALPIGLSAQGTPRTPTFEDLYESGLQALKAGQAAKAAAALAEVVRAKPHDQAARDAWGQALVQLGQFPEAIEQFRALTELDARNAHAWFSLGEAELRFALTLANGVLETDRESPYARRIFAENYLAREDWPEAEKQYQLALAAQPEAADLRIALGDVLAREGKWDEAAREYLRAIKTDGAALLPRARMGMIYFLEGQVAPALDEFQKVEAVNPQFLALQLQSPEPAFPPAAWKSACQKLEVASKPPAVDSVVLLVRSVCSNRTGKGGNTASALAAGTPPSATPCAAGYCQACEEQLRDRLTNPQAAASAHLTVGQCALQGGDIDQAYNHFLAAHRAEPSSAAAAFWLQETARRLAERAFERLRAIDPDSVLVHLLNAQNWEGQQQPARAIQEYKAALARQPAAANIHTMLGHLYWKWQRYDEALPELLAALRLEPSDPAANYLAGDTWVQKHEPSKGLPYLKRALEARPGFLNAEASLGRALAEMGRYQEAAAELEKVADADADGALHYQLYQVYLKLGRGEDAKRALARSAKLREMHREKSGFQPTPAIP